MINRIQCLCLHWSEDVFIFFTREPACCQDHHPHCLSVIVNCRYLGTSSCYIARWLDTLKPTNTAPDKRPQALDAMRNDTEGSSLPLQDKVTNALKFLIFRHFRLGLRHLEFLIRDQGFIPSSPNTKQILSSPLCLN